MASPSVISFLAPPFATSYLLYLGIMLWAPIPLGSYAFAHRIVLAGLIFLCALLTLIEAMVRHIDLGRHLRPFSLPILLLLAVSVWSAIQLVPLDAGLLTAVAPEIAASYHAAGLEQGRLSVSPGDTSISVLLTFSLWAFFVLSLVLNSSEQRLRLTLMTIVLSGTAQALYGSFMTLTGIEYGFLAEKIDFRGVATGTFPTRNSLAAYLEMCLACGIGLMICNLDRATHRNWKQVLRASMEAILGAKMRLRVYLAFMVIGLVLTRSRMGNSVFFAALPICGMLYMIMERRINWRAIILFTSLILVDSLIVGQWFGFDELAQRLEGTSIEKEDRDEQVLDSLPMLEASPLVGYGLGTFYVASAKFQDSSPVHYDHVHNDYLEFAIELGLLGFIPLGLLVVCSAWMAVSALFKRRRPLGKGAGFAATMGILCLLLHSIVDFNLQIPANALLFVFILALAWMARHQKWREH